MEVFVEGDEGGVQRGWGLRVGGDKVAELQNTRVDS